MQKKNEQALMINLAILFVVITILMGFAAFVLKQYWQPAQGNQDPALQAATSQMSAEPEEETEPEPEEPSGPISDATAMRGVKLEPGRDFLTAAKDAFAQAEKNAVGDEETPPTGEAVELPQVEESQVKEELDRAVQRAGELGMNTLLLPVNTYLGTAYESSQGRSLAGFDLAAYLCGQAQEAGLRLYAVYDLSILPGTDGGQPMETIDAQALEAARTELEQLASVCPWDGILLTGWGNPDTEDAYLLYTQQGGGAGYDAWMCSRSQSLVQTAVQAVKEQNPELRVGVQADAVWATQTQSEEGIETQRTTGDRYGRFADTLALIQQEQVDFVAVLADTSMTDPALPFDTLVQWWDNQFRQTQVQGYLIHTASQCGTWGNGWNEPDQLVRQAQAVEDSLALSGSIYDALYHFDTTAKNNGANLAEYYATLSDQLDKDPDAQAEEEEEEEPEEKPERVLKELTFTKPTESSLTTTDTSYTFQGACDPEQPVTLDGQALGTDESGFFSYTVDLEPGKNTYTFQQGEQTKTFTITRQVKVLKEVSPTGTLAVDGGMKVNLTAVAYEGSTVTATFNGQTIALKAEDSQGDEELRGTTYQRYSGSFTAPAAGKSAQSLGAVSFTANYDGNTETLTGASVTVNKAAQVTDGQLVKVTSQQAITFPADKLGKYPDPDCYPLPYGTMDYAVGDQVTYKEGSDVRTYYNLASGRRVYTDDVQAVSEDRVLDGNVISGMTVKADSNYTYVILNSANPVSFLPEWTTNQFTIQFSYTTSVPEGMTLTKNPLFTSASWEGSTLKLALATPGTFLGYKAYHEDGQIVFRFNNPTTLSGARICIDPGHGGSDPGAEGFNPGYPESEINWEMANAIADELESRGASVLLLKTGSRSMTMDERLAQARDFNAQVYISVHGNSSVNSAAAGSECYYFFPFAKDLAAQISSATSAGLSTNNRGAKYDVYYVTRDPQFVGVLAECGFLTNQKEYNKLIDEDYQESVANKIASALEQFFASSGANRAGITGTQTVGDSSGNVSEGPTSGSTGSGQTSGSQNSTSGSQSGSSTGKVDYVSIEQNELKLYVGDKEELHADIKCTGTVDARFSSGNEDVAKVSAQGTVYATGIGSTVITLTAGDKTDTCTVTVYGTESDTGVFVPAERIEIKGPKTISVGEFVQYRVQFYPDNASNQRVTWEVSQSGAQYADVGTNGAVEGIAPGWVTIRATSEDGGYTATFRFEVVE